MKLFDFQAIQDLEFDLIRVILHDYCIGPTAKLRMVELVPQHDEKLIWRLLNETKEFHSIREESLSFPTLDFEELLSEIRTLEVRDSVLHIDEILRLKQAAELVNDVVKFFSKQDKQRFLHLRELLKEVHKEDFIPKAVDRIFDRKGEVKDDASPELQRIRDEFRAVKRQINRNFLKVLKSMADRDLLSETKEAYVNERRVLSVLSSHKRKIPGTVLGSSKTGSQTYIEPQVNVALNFELEMLQDDERKEIYRILKELTDQIRTQLPLIKSYQVLLTELDFINAKSKLARELNADLPGISEEMKIELHEAYHPLLLLSNKKEGLTTLPQTLSMDKFSRMLVISGPNAGGKSITLKMIGLLQIMFQSGLLIPVDPTSKLCVFHGVLTDIGDHQSIENQLSTYSYRLKRMKHFLEVANRRTLLLLDEFGTGSDPDLGGALAEVFFEKLYNKKCFGVITTHYSNIKLKADDLKNAINACMLFDQVSLEPSYKLLIGQPGSSFTFEVAELNGIDPDLIKQAKGKLDSRKVKMDSLLSTLQKERSKFEKMSKETLKVMRDAEKTEATFKKGKEKLDDRLKTQQELTERNNKYLSKGKKLENFIDRYSTKQGNKKLLAEINKYLAVEKSKLEDAVKVKKLKSKTNSKEKPAKPKANQDKIQVGSLVKLLKGRQTGNVLEVKGKNAVVAFGVMKTKVELNKLVFVK